MAKATKHIIRMESTGLNSRGKPTKHSYATHKNKRNSSEKLELMKFDPIARKHVLYKEKKA